MSGIVTKRMIEAYIQMASPTAFFAGMFASPAQNFHNSEEVEIDILRNDEDVSIVVQDLSTGYRMNAEDIYTNKAFKPPIHKEAVTLNSEDLLKRMPGKNPFENPEFRAALVTRMFGKMTKIENKIRRAIELQASQVLQNGTVTLTDSSGAALYTIDYKPKATHFPTVGTAWTAGAGDPLADLEALAEVVRNDGQADVDEIIVGSAAFDAMLQNTKLKDRFDNRRVEMGRIAPMEKRGNGGNYRGVLEIGNYKVDVWTYGGRYKNPNGGAMTQFLTPANVVMRASSGRMDATFGSIPNIGKLLGAQRTDLLPELPGRVSNIGGGMDLHTNVWLSNDGEALMGGVGARPLLVPTAIDTFGCLRTGV